MSFASVLSTIGKDIKAVFTWIGNPAGQAVIKTAEGVAVTIDPALSGIVSLANNFIAEAFKIESLAVGAAAQSGTGVQKSAAVVAALTPAVLEYAQQNGLPTPNATHIQEASDAIVAFLNALPGKTS